MMFFGQPFPLTAYMKKDPEFGALANYIWWILESKILLLKIAGHKELMQNYPDGKAASIQVRERIVIHCWLYSNMFTKNKRTQ
jgi:phosphoenolpyruvate carboxylase